MLGTAGRAHAVTSAPGCDVASRTGKVPRGARRRVRTRVGAAFALLALAVALTISLAANASATSYGAVAWGNNSLDELGDGIELGPEKCAPDFEAYCSKTPVTVDGLSGVTQIAAGSAATLALLSNGTVMAWGTSPEVGDGEYNGETDVPVPVCAVGSEGPCPHGPYLSGVTAVAAGSASSMALLSDGTVATWGADGEGTLGDGSPEPRTNPTAVCSVGTEFSNDEFCTKGILKEVSAIAAGSSFAMALLDNGTVVDWGNDNSGQLGDGSENAEYGPVAVSGLSKVTAISAGGYDGLALLEDGTVKAWGDNSEGELGDGTSTGPSKCGTDGCSLTPIAVSALSGVTALTSGLSDSYALLSGGKVMAWGGNADGALGDGTSSGPEHCDRPCSTTPVEVSGLSGVKALGSGAEDALALLDSGALEGWGANETGELGDGTTTNSDVPIGIPVCLLGEVAGVSTGSDAEASFAFGTPSSACSPPEFGRCVKVAKGAGKYSSSGCTSLGGTAGYEWSTGALEDAFTTGLASGSVTFETTGGSKVSCTGETGAGQYTGAKTVGSETITLTGCSRGGEKCSSASAAAGEIVSSSLEGTLGVEKLGASAAKNKIGLDLFPVGKAGSVMEFSCGSTSVTVQGSVIVPLKADKMSFTQALKFKAAKGKQKPERFVAGAKDVLEASFNHEALVQVGLTLTVTQTGKEALEVNSAV